MHTKIIDYPGPKNVVQVTRGHVMAGRGTTLTSVLALMSTLGDGFISEVLGEVEKASSIHLFRICLLHAGVFIAVAYKRDTQRQGHLGHGDIMGLAYIFASRSARLYKCRTAGDSPPHWETNFTMAPRVTSGYAGADDIGHASGHKGTGGKGGVGHGLIFGEPLVRIREGAEPKVPELYANTKTFCANHSIGKIAKPLQENGFESVRALLHVTDKDLGEAGFKVGHIAELKWALKSIARKELYEPPGKPELYGGVGGRGGHGDCRGGEGGEGDRPDLPNGLISRFAKIEGGIGGVGGTGGRDLQTSPNGNKPSTRVRRMLPSFFDKAQKKNEAEGTWVHGGIGGMGGRGSHRGGEGGIGEPSHIPTGILYRFTKIFGGVGGEGGIGGIFGGRGGRGRASAFYESLGYADTRARGAKPTLLQDFPISEDLPQAPRRARIYNCGRIIRSD
ncbi:hypothetical protein MSAN_02193000 [Mycena sanguinolenta]|uniref:Uncharacterized protein n=1 Tax=Mycena sanguinolenta TaxID=230812 RepID=A0A8H6XCT8_9AGAR|nr:hypothetical protein MSAN_02193000 [Mycena sanguinolenta]